MGAAFCVTFEYVSPEASVVPRVTLSGRGELKVPEQRTAPVLCLMPSQLLEELTYAFFPSDF